MRIIDSTDKQYIGYDIPELSIGQTFKFSDDFIFICQGKSINSESNTITYSNPNYIIIVRSV